MEGPLLWFLNRGTGFALLGVLTVTVVVGVLATRGNAGRRVPRFLTQALHRNIGLLTVVALAVHVVTAVVDEFVEIQWWHAFVPIGGTYQPLWLGLGALALDLLAVVVLTSLLRHRMPHRSWRYLHLTTYVAWAASVLHGIGIGTDTDTGWATWTYATCAGAFGIAVLIRLYGSLRALLEKRRLAAAVPGSTDTTTRNLTRVGGIR